MPLKRRYLGYAEEGPVTGAVPEDCGRWMVGGALWAVGDGLWPVGYGPWWAVGRECVCEAVPNVHHRPIGELGVRHIEGELCPTRTLRARVFALNIDFQCEGRRFSNLEGSVLPSTVPMGQKGGVS